MKNELQSIRLHSLDALRGFDMLWIIGVDDLFHQLAKNTNITFFKAISHQLDHTVWNGFTAYDMIFPLFLFISGVASPYSIGRKLEKGISKKAILQQILIRCLLLLLFGFIYNNGLGIHPLEKYRFPSVLGRIGTAYLFANIIYLYTNKKMQVVWVGILLIGYWLLLSFTSAFGFNAGDLSMEGNVVSYIDRLLLPGSLYNTVHDPEGILSTIPAISTGLLGILTGNFLMYNNTTQSRKTLIMLILGFVFILLAQIWALVFPINKNLWTSSFVLQAGGISLLLLAFFYYVIDVCGYKKWAFPLKVIGMNSIAIYMSAVFIDYAFTAKSLFAWAIQLTCKPFQIFVSVICILVVKWLLLYFLYKKKIFLKI